MTSFISHPSIERDPRERMLAPAITTPLVTTTLTIQHRLLRNQPSRLERVPFAPGTIGHDADITIDDLFLTAKHAVFELGADGLHLRDLGSTNGSYVNERRVQDELLRAGDILHLGQQRLWLTHTLATAPRFPERAIPLLRSIIAAPDDDAPRMVLADLLSELGDPRGEFIACQISNAQQRADELLVEHGLAWAGPFPLPVHHWTFRRGFIDAIYVDDLEASRSILDDHPLAELKLVPALVD